MTAVYLYPWDVDGDPAAASRIAGLGVSEVALAASYHDVRAVTRFHPAHRIVSRSAAAYYAPDPGRWYGARLRPAVSGADPAGSFERAAGQLRAAGLRVTAWTVVTHNETIGAAEPEVVVRGAFGDPYPWALCIGQPAVREYAATLAAEVAGLDCVDGIELEACGWYGFDHLSSHDKTGGAPAGDASWLLDVCFCASCSATFAAAGLDPAKLRADVRTAVDDSIAGADGRLAQDVEQTMLHVRSAVACSFARQVIAAARDAAAGKTVLVQGHPDQRVAGSNPGLDPRSVLGPAGADAFVVNCPGPVPESTALVSSAAAHAPAVAGTRAGAGVGARAGAGATAVAGAGAVSVTLNAVAALSPHVGILHSHAAAMRDAGVSDLRIYHAGLASAADLTAIRQLAEP